LRIQERDILFLHVVCYLVEKSRITFSILSALGEMRQSITRLNVTGLGMHSHLFCYGHIPALLWACSLFHLTPLLKLYGLNEWEMK
jgi:hypothetical protein